MKRAINIIGLLMVILGVAAACAKDERMGVMTVRMVDQPIAFQEVNVEIRAVQVKYEDRNRMGWVSLDTKKGVYNLLELQNGISATLVDEDYMPHGHISQMRLVLGNQNSVKVNGSYSSLAMSSQDETGLKLNLDAEVRRGEHIDILFDFDARESIVVQGNGTYRLKPVLHLVHVKRL